MLISDHIAIKCPECGCDEFEEIQMEEENSYVICSSCKAQLSDADLEDEGMEQAKKVVVSETKETVVKFFKGLVTGEKLF